MTKNIIILILGAFLLIAAASNTSLLSSRSNVQVVLHGSDLNQLTNSINSYYTSGYRVIFMVSQPVSTSVNSSEYNHAFHGNYRDIKGEIMVVMEK